MKKYTEYPKYNMLSQEEKNVLSFLGTTYLELGFQALDINAKLRFLNTIMEMESFWDPEGIPYDPEDTEWIKDNLKSLGYSIIYDLDKRDSNYTIFSNVTSEPYLFDGVDEEGDNVLGVRIYTSEVAAKKAISAMTDAKKNLFVEHVDGLLDFINKGRGYKGYGFFDIRNDSTNYQIDSFFLGYNDNGILDSLLTRQLQEKENTYSTKNKKEKMKIAEELASAILFVPATVDGTWSEYSKVINTNKNNNLPKYILPVFTSLEKFAYKSDKGRTACVPMSVVDILNIADICNTVPIVNMYSTRYIIDGKMKMMITDLLKD